MHAQPLPYDRNLIKAEGEDIRTEGHTPHCLMLTEETHTHTHTSLLMPTRETAGMVGWRRVGRRFGASTVDSFISRDSRATGCHAYQSSSLYVLLCVCVRFAVSTWCSLFALLCNFLTYIPPASINNAISAALWAKFNVFLLILNRDMIIFLLLCYGYGYFRIISQ